MNEIVPGRVVRSETIEVSSEVWRQLCRLANGVRVCLNRHSERMRTDPEYRAAVEYLMAHLSSRSGRVGQVVRVVHAGHTLLVKVL